MPIVCYTNLLTYERFAPEKMRWQGCFAIEKHSGQHLLSNVLQQHQITLNPSETQSGLDPVQNLSVEVKRSLTVEELVNLAKNYSSIYEPVRPT